MFADMWALIPIQAVSQRQVDWLPLHHASPSADGPSQGLSSIDEHECSHTGSIVLAHSHGLGANELCSQGAKAMLTLYWMKEVCRCRDEQQCAVDTRLMP